MKPECRICFAGCDEDPEELVADLCRCRGSLRYIHASCLRSWFSSKQIGDNGREKHRMIAKIRDNPICSVCDSHFNDRVAICYQWKPMTQWRLYRSVVFFVLKVCVVFAIVKTLFSLINYELFADIATLCSRVPFVVLLLCYLAIFVKFIWYEFVVVNTELSMVVLKARKINSIETK